LLLLQILASIEVSASREICTHKVMQTICSAWPMSR